MKSHELRSFLERRGLSTLAFANLIGVTHVAVLNWLDEKRSINKTIGRLCRLFDAHPELMEEFKK